MTLMMALALLGAQAERAEPLAVPDAEAVQTMHRVAACVVRERTGEVRAVLAMDFRTDAYRRRLLGLADSAEGCFRRWMAIEGLNFAGSLAEQLFLRDHATADPAGLVSTGLPDSRSRSEALSYCVVGRSPVEARTVLGTEVTSEAEATALDALRPAIAACLEGEEEAHLNRPGLRSLVALAFYRLARSRADQS
ncbi:MAG: hypothetical protein ACXWUR_13360 [Allosphingosinicella sp.]